MELHAGRVRRFNFPPCAVVHKLTQIDYGHLYRVGTQPQHSTAPTATPTDKVLRLSWVVQAVVKGRRALTVHCCTYRCGVLNDYITRYMLKLDEELTLNYSTYFGMFL